MECHGKMVVEIRITRSYEYLWYEIRRNVMVGGRATCWMSNTCTKRRDPYNGTVTRTSEIVDAVNDDDGGVEITGMSRG